MQLGKKKKVLGFFFFSSSWGFYLSYRYPLESTLFVVFFPNGHLQTCDSVQPF